MTQAEPLMTVIQLSNFLACSESWIYKMVESKQIPHIRLGASIRFRSPDIVAWLATRTATPAGSPT